MLHNTLPASFQSTRGRLRDMEQPKHPGLHESAGDCTLCGCDTSWWAARWYTRQDKRALICRDCVEARYGT